MPSYKTLTTRGPLYTLLVVGLCASLAIPFSVTFAQAKELATVCHEPGTPDEKTLQVAAPAVSGHLAHGDYPGPCDPTLVGFWGFDEGKGDTANDVSGLENQGKLENGTAWVPGHLGILGSGVGFDGTNDLDLVRVLDDDSLDFGENEDFSISLWFRDETAEEGNTANSPEMLEKQGIPADTAPFYQVRSPDANETLRVQVDDGPLQDRFNTTLGVALADGKWHHLVVIRDYDAGIFGYVDGILEGEDADRIAGSLVNNGDLLFGAGNSAGSYDGELDNVSIYRRALSKEEVIDLKRSS